MVCAVTPSEVSYDSHSFWRVPLVELDDEDNIEIEKFQQENKEDIELIKEQYMARYLETRGRNRSGLHFHYLGEDFTFF